VGYDCEFCWRYHFGPPRKKEGAAYVNLLATTRTLTNQCTVGGYIINVAMFTVATALIAKYSETYSKGYAAAALTFLFLYVAA
jgi:Mg2+/Co2+ transporter CorB